MYITYRLRQGLHEFPICKLANTIAFCILYKKKNKTTSRTNTMIDTFHSITLTLDLKKISPFSVGHDNARFRELFNILYKSKGEMVIWDWTWRHLSLKFVKKEYLSRLPSCTLMVPSMLQRTYLFYVHSGARTFQCDNLDKVWSDIESLAIGCLNLSNNDSQSQPIASHLVDIIAVNDALPMSMCKWKTSILTIFLFVVASTS